MPRLFTSLSIIAPLIAVPLGNAVAQDLTTPLLVGDFIGNPFELDARSLDPIQFTRLPDAPADIKTHSETLTEVSFELRPQRPDFSRQGFFGLGLIGRPQLQVQSNPTGVDAARTGLNDGFSYSAGLRVEHEETVIDDTAYVSSSLLGVSYGRLGRLWYGGIDVNVEQFRDGIDGEDPAEVVSLDLTTGRRLGITGLDTTSPLWLLSLQGNVDLQDLDEGDDQGLQPNWFLNPSLFWEQPGFTFSAEMQVPVSPLIDDTVTDQPDYRLRAVFEKHFR